MAFPLCCNQSECSFRSRESSLQSPISEGSGFEEPNRLYLFDLDPLNVEASLLIEAVKEHQLATFHYGMILLCDLIALREI